MTVSLPLTGTVGKGKKGKKSACKPNKHSSIFSVLSAEYISRQKILGIEILFPEFTSYFHHSENLPDLTSYPN